MRRAQFPHVSTKHMVGAGREVNSVMRRFVGCDNEAGRYVLTGLNCSINVSFTL